jgi:hypothetical protein
VLSSDRQKTHALAVSHGLWIGATSCFAQADEDAHNLSPVVEGMNAWRQFPQRFNSSPGHTMAVSKFVATYKANICIPLRFFCCLACVGSNGTIDTSR